MLVQQLKIRSVNAHRLNNGIHSMLHQDDEVNILLIQEPWFYTVATLRSDDNPEGTPQKGVPINDKWVHLLPTHTQSDTCKTAAYVAKNIALAVKIHLDHPLTSLNSMVLDVMDDDVVALRIYNIYHAVPQRGHDLHHLLMHDIDDLTPTLIMGDFNTHSPRWSINDHPTSSWACALTDWANAQGLTCLNPRDTPTWYDPSARNTLPSIIDLAFINEATAFSGQIGDLDVSNGPFPLTDHAVLTLTFYPITSLHLLPPPAPAGYSANPKAKEQWQKKFKQLHDEQPTPAPTASLQDLLDDFDHLVQAACKETLKPCRNPHPKGAKWWTDECTRLHTVVHTTPPGPQRKAASKAFKAGVTQAKCKWAHDRLHQAVDAQDIWALAKV